MGGLLVLLPVMLLYLLLAEMLEVAVALATPIADLLPWRIADAPTFPVLLAIGLILSTSVVLGLLMRSALSYRLGRWVERCFLHPIPGYDFLKNLTHSLGNTKKVNGFRPALKKLPGGGFQAAYVVEDDGNGTYTLLLPHAPAAMSGPVEIVPRDQVRILDVGFGKFMQSLNHWGTGLQHLTQPSDSNPHSNL